MIDSEIVLPDGRRFAYADGGAPDGPLAFYFHGAPTSRLDLGALEGEFTAHGLRVVSPDRPGYGGSTPRPGRRIDDITPDVAALADVLGVSRFAVIGLSSGGPYAAACAAKLSDRVIGAGIVAGVTDFGWPDAWRGYDEVEVEVMRARDEASAIAVSERHFGADGSKFAESIGDLAPADVALFADASLAEVFTATMREAFRQGCIGYAHDMQAQGRPWSFDPEAITAPVEVWHGQHDTLVPLAHAQHTAEVIPTARLRLLPGHGHLSIMTEIPALATTLVEPLR